FANGVLTWRAILATLYGVLPPLNMSTMHDLMAHCLVGLPQLLGAAGYRPVFVKGGDLAFEDNGPFCLTHGFAEALGHNDIRRAYPEATGSSWGCDDEYLVRF